MGKTVLVTGASSGIGEATCRLLVENGFRVAGTSRDPQRLAPLAQQLGEAFSPLALDVNDPSAVTSLPSALPSDFGGLDVLVNNAGHDTGGRRPFEDTDPDAMHSVIETNVQGLFRVTRALIGGMLEQGSGHIVNIGSEVGMYPVASMGAYVASKYAVHGFSETLRLEYAGRGVRVTEIMPGRVRTGFAEQRLGDAGLAKEFYDSYPQCLEATDIAGSVLYALQQPAHVEVAQLLIVPTS